MAASPPLPQLCCVSCMILISPQVDESEVVAGLGLGEVLCQPAAQRGSQPLDGSGHRAAGRWARWVGGWVLGAAAAHQGQKVAVGATGREDTKPPTSDSDRFICCASPAHSGPSSAARAGAAASASPAGGGCQGSQA